MAYERREEKSKEFEERVISVDRVSYTVAGGRRMRFRALVVIGNRQGRVGMGLAKAGEVQAAVQKAVASAKKRMITVPIIRNTIPHAIEMKYGSGHVLLKPAPEGTSVLAGGSVRAVIELAGIKNILSKALGSNNKVNNVMATLEALRRLRRSPETEKQPAPQVEVAAVSPDSVEPIVAPVPGAAERAEAAATTRPKTSRAKKSTKK